MTDWLLPYLPKDLILAAYAAAPGNEHDSGKLQSNESSAALVANVFGYFLTRPESLPVSALFADCSEKPIAINLEREMRFPWSGGLHPWLDIAIETNGWLIGVEAKRYEPFRA